MNTDDVDAYLKDGCGRCDLYRTPQCKVHRWTPTLTTLRELLVASELQETLKWGSPCYTLDGSNVLMMAALKEYSCLSFFKGVALNDPDGRLVSQGPNSRFARLLKFTSVKEVRQQRAQIMDFIAQAIDLQRRGIKVVPAPDTLSMPDELADRLSADITLRQAFDALTPGRQRSHLLHVSGAKKALTRLNRVEKCAAKIMAGKGFNER